MILHTFSEFISHNIHTFKELPRNKSKLTFKSSYQTLLTLSGSYYQTIQHNLPDI